MAGVIVRSTIAGDKSGVPGLARLALESKLRTWIIRASKLRVHLSLLNALFAQLSPTRLEELI